MSLHLPMGVAVALVPVAGGVGAYLRYRTETLVRAGLHRAGVDTELEAEAPVIRHLAKAWPIMIVNVIGCFIAGLLASTLLADPTWGLPLGTGLLGGFTTFSTAMMDAYSIALRPEQHALPVRLRALVLAAGLTLVLCALAAITGIAFSRAFL